MKRAADLADFLAQPLGRCLDGPCWVYFYPHEDLCGFAIWGRPDAEALERLVRVLRVELDAAPHASIVIADALEAVDPAAFDVLKTYVEQNVKVLSRVVRKVALVAPRTGLVRAVAAGFFDVAPPPYPVELFDDPLRALAWLDTRAPESVVGAIQAAQEEVMGVPAGLRELRAWMGANLLDAALEGAARALGVSTRSLQRRLKEAGTTFQQELKIVQVNLAQRMLVDTDAPITRIALDLGLTPTHFSALFRSATGLSPREWRERRRVGS